jgi:ribosome assembly protein 4
MIVSGSKDSTLKLWDVKEKNTGKESKNIRGGYGKIKVDLPGHLDEVYALDWSPNVKDSCLLSGGKDKSLKFWRQ